MKEKVTLTELKQIIKKIVTEELLEGVGKNNPKLEKYIAKVNTLILQAVDSEGDPLDVIDTTSTWQEPYIYYPITYKNGILTITCKSVFSNKKEVDVIKPSRIEYDGIPQLRMIYRMYKKAVN